MPAQSYYSSVTVLPLQYANKTLLRCFSSVFFEPLSEQGSAVSEPQLSCYVDLMCSSCLSSHSEAFDALTFAVGCLENRNQWLAMNGSCDSSGYSRANFDTVESLENSQEYLLRLQNTCTSLLGLLICLALNAGMSDAD